MISMCAMSAQTGTYVDENGFTRCGYCGEVAGWIPRKEKPQ